MTRIEITNIDHGVVDVDFDVDTILVNITFRREDVTRLKEIIQALEGR